MRYGQAVSIVQATRLVSVFLVLVASGVSLLFLYSGVEKWSDLGQFQVTIASHGLLNEDFAKGAGIVLAMVEVAIGSLGVLLLMVRGTPAAGSVLIMAASLFLVFSVYSAFLVVSPPSQPTSCGCGLLSSSSADWTQILTRSSVIAGLLGFGALCAIRFAPRRSLVQV